MAKPEFEGEPHVFETGPLELPTYELGEEVATRKAYGDALKALGDGRGDVVALDGEVSNSTYAEIFAKAHPERYFEMFIAEQQLVAAAVGLQVRNWKPFASTFAAFFTRAYDFVRMAAISRAEHQALRLARGRLDRRGRPVADGARGSRGLPGRPRLDRPLPLGREPDGQARRGHGRPGRDLVHADDARRDAGHLRAGRGVPGRRVQGRPLLGQRRGDDRRRGHHLHEALKAADTLAEEGVSARVIDLYSVKPIDVETLRAAAEATGGRFVTAEDHWPEGGLGEAVLSAFADADERPRVIHLAVREMPTSGKPAELLAAAGIDAEHIAAAARRLVEAQTGAAV